MTERHFTLDEAHALVPWLQQTFDALGPLKPESTEGRPWGQPLKKLEGAPLNLG